MLAQVAHLGESILELRRQLYSSPYVERRITILDSDRMNRAVILINEQLSFVTAIVIYNSCFDRRRINIVSIQDQLQRNGSCD